MEQKAVASLFLTILEKRNQLLQDGLPGTKTLDPTLYLQYDKGKYIYIGDSIESAHSFEYGASGDSDKNGYSVDSVGSSDSRKFGYSVEFCDSGKSGESGNYGHSGDLN